MAKLKLTGKELRAIGYPERPVISIAMYLMQKNYKLHTKEEVMEILKAVLANPVEYKDDVVLALIAKEFIKKPESAKVSPPTGGGDLEGAGALMPDAHSGYGLPIGAVLATENAVTPYGVGVDIGCRMCLSIFDMNAKKLTQKESYFASEVLFHAKKQRRQSNKD